MRTGSSADAPAPPSPAVAHPWHLTPGQRLYMWLTGVFVTCLLMANVLGVKLFRIDLEWSEGNVLPIEHTVGMLPFPITFVLTDLVNEYYGKKAARRIAYIGFTMAMLAFVLITLARQIPIREGVPGTATQAAFENIFGSASLMYIASVMAFLLGSLLDIFLFGIFKRLTRGRMVWLRATGSTVISQLFDSFVITFLFFWLFPRVLGEESATLGFVFSMALTGYVLKLVIAIALTPVIYLGRWSIRRLVGIQPLPPE